MSFIAYSEKKQESGGICARSRNALVRKKKKETVKERKRGERSGGKGMKMRVENKRFSDKCPKF